ncbi:MAG: KpsF/GutQ family sugar-phosphate isomerase [Alphaproteobacteria bacterium]|nr:KpsF/GutQ family sugar-phosphate isomerase [Alphaproteobacteria bacterium]
MDDRTLDTAPAAELTARSALRTLELERAGIAAVEAAFTDPQNSRLAQEFARAVELIRTRTGRVMVSGMGKSGHIGRKIAATLASTGTPAYFVHPGEASHGDLGMIKPSDAILLMSWSGETAELADIITYSRRHQIGLVAITSNENSTLGREADVVLALPKSEEACPNGLAPTTSTTMQLAMGDALSIALLEAKGFTAQDFRNFHPGGKLGAVLTFVRQIMHTDERLPLIGEHESMSEAIMEMTARGFGCVAVIGKDGRISGVITDGDLRRHMGPDLMTRPVEAVMSRNPKTITGDLMAAEALEILNSRTITALFVVDGAGKPQGIVHMHDLLRLGVA